MAYKYWEDSSTNTESYTNSSWCYGDTTSNNVVYYYVPPREILVTEPECWTDEDGLAFIDLVNNQTRTGWLVTMRIKGDVLITDPRIETRTMKEFLPLLRWCANSDDRKKIAAFFEEHPIRRA